MKQVNVFSFYKRVSSFKGSCSPTAAARNNIVYLQEYFNNCLRLFGYYHSPVFYSLTVWHWSGHLRTIVQVGCSNVNLITTLHVKCFLLPFHLEPET